MNQEQNKNNKTAKECLKIEDGFSSQQEEQEEIVYTMPELIDDFLHNNNEEAKIKMQGQSVRDVTSKRYSLEPDMVNGWQPKVPMIRPIPLIFTNYQFDQLLDKMQEKKRSSQQKQQSQFKLCYLGARYETTYYAWYDRQFQFPYAHLNPPKSQTITDRAFVGQHWDAEKPEILQFDSLFESGNLDCAVKVGEDEYDLFIRVDSNTRGHLQWYNFKVKNLKAGKPYKINICNLQKGKSLYMRGMKPYYCSIKALELQNKGWHQIQGDIKYRKKPNKTQKLLQYENSEKFYELSFQISTKYENDQLQIAYCVPYTYSYLKKYLNSLLLTNLQRNIVSLRKLCLSLGGNAIDELTITENVDEQEKSFKSKTRLDKKVIFVTGRCHPGQSNGSWMVEGLIDFLCGHSEIAYFLRKNVIFKIVPLLNPDGVILGNYRTGAFGKDFNRQFNDPDKDVFPEIYNLREMFRKYKQIYRQNAFMYLDFHGHSVKKNVFAYGPEYPITDKNYYQSKMIAKLIGSKTKMFRYHSCIFKIAESKQSTGRAIFLRSHKIPFTFTIQASNGSYFDQDECKSFDFTSDKWKQIGQKTIEGIYEYIKLIIQLERIKMQKMKQRQMVLLKKRERAKVKKHKNSDLGYFTSLGFRKCKTLINQDTEILQKQQNFKVKQMRDSESGMNEFQQNPLINDLLEQIKKQDKQSRENGEKNSQDEISQGSSDSEGLNDDLDQNLQRQLFSLIKAKKTTKRIKLKTENRPKNQLSPQIVQLSRDQEIEDKEKLGLKQKSKQILIKKLAWKKKSTIFSSVSPKRQDQSQNAAKIVNFNFSLNPIQCTLSQSSALQSTQGSNRNKNYQAASTFNSTYYTFKSSSNRLNSKNEEKAANSNQVSELGIQKRRGYEYSENFRKTFISVQKQILRRDSYKRYLISVNSSQKKSNYIEDVRGKRIVGSSTRQEDQDKLMMYSRQHRVKTEIMKQAEIKSPTRVAHQKACLNRKKVAQKKPESQVIIFEQQTI